MPADDPRPPPPGAPATPSAAAPLLPAEPPGPRWPERATRATALAVALACAAVLLFGTEWSPHRPARLFQQCWMGAGSVRPCAHLPRPLNRQSVRTLPLGAVPAPQDSPIARPKKAPKLRLDDLLQQRHPQYTKNVLQAFIKTGKVFLNDQPELKCGTQVREDADVELRANPPEFVCRAGLKLARALDAFAVNVTGLRALDAGLSTGGFTDCLLQRGAAQVYGVDVGYGLVAERIRVDPRVVLLERTNLRHLEALPGGAPPVDLVTLDLSFISVLHVLPAVARHLLAPAPGAQMIVLIKPQFEGTREDISRGGVVREEARRHRIVAKTVAGVEAFGFRCTGWTESPLKGAKGGNTEYLAHFVRTAATPAEFASPPESPANHSR